MCLIVDNNIVHRVLLQPDDNDFKHVHQALFGSRPPIAEIVYGGKKLMGEYARSTAVIEVLLQLRRAGRAKVEDSDQVDDEANRVAKTGFCKSDDEHIIALARVSGVRLLCSLDKNLADDFTNKALIDKPRGKVYKYSSHRKLLSQFCS
jgi:hypothetical protein